VFAAHELVKNSSSSKIFKEGVSVVRQVQDIQTSQILPESAEFLARKIEEREGMSQRRSGGQADGEDEKFRVTLECRHAVLNFFSESEQPRSVELPPILIVSGVHCRLDNITEDRRWKVDEVLDIGGEILTRKQGEKLPPALMESWTSLRKLHPEYFEQIVVMQQPAATVDEIIVGWGLEDLGRRFPCGVLQRDLVSGALSSRARMAAYLQQFVCAWVAPGMTPVVQITDTDVAFPLKAKINRKKKELVQELSKLAIQEGRDRIFQDGSPELMWVLTRAQADFKEEFDAAGGRSSQGFPEERSARVHDGQREAREVDPGGLPLGGEAPASRKSQVSVEVAGRSLLVAQGRSSGRAQVGAVSHAAREAGDRGGIGGCGEAQR